MLQIMNRYLFITDPVLFCLTNGFCMFCCSGGTTHETIIMALTLNVSYNWGMKHNKELLKLHTHAHRHTRTFKHNTQTHACKHIYACTYTQTQHTYTHRAHACSCIAQTHTYTTCMHTNTHTTLHACAHTHTTPHAHTRARKLRVCTYTHRGKLQHVTYTLSSPVAVPMNNNLRKLSNVIQDGAIGNPWLHCYEGNIESMKPMWEAN